MTKTDLIAQVAANTEMSKKSAEMAVNAAFEALGKAMAEGEKISISGFGTFEVRERAERQGSERHPVKTAFCRRNLPPRPGGFCCVNLSVIASRCQPLPFRHFRATSPDRGSLS